MTLEIPSFLGKLAGQQAGLGLSTISAANMNGWHKVGSRTEAANDRMWVFLTCRVGRAQPQPALHAKGVDVLNLPSSRPPLNRVKKV